MTDPHDLAAQHESLTRRYFMQLSAAGAALSSSALWAAEGELPKAVQAAVAKMEYLTPPDKFRLLGRGKPPPHTLPADKLRAVGLSRKTWWLEVVSMSV